MMLNKEELRWLIETLEYSIDEYEMPDIAYSIYDKLKAMKADD